MLAGYNIVSEADMQAHARCRYVRSAGKFCQTGNPAIVDVRDPATMACHDRVGQSGRGRRSHSALSVAYALEFLPGAAIGQRLFGERPSRPCQSQLADFRSEEHTSELQSLMRISYAVFCLKKKKQQQ